MPKDIPTDLQSVGGKLTEKGRDNFLRKARETRERILRNEPIYREITASVFSAEYRGTLSKPAANSSLPKRKGKRMPKATTNLVNVTSVAGKRGRKSELNPNEWVMEIGIENSFDVSDEMNSGIEKYCAKNKVKPFSPDTLFGNENSDANKYRANRFGTMKRAAIAANGDETKYELNSAEDSDGNRVWVFVRTA